MAKKRKKQTRRCPVCSAGLEVDYKETSLLKKFISERGKILARARSGACARHQRELTRSIKRARYMALLSFVER